MKTGHISYGMGEGVASLSEILNIKQAHVFIKQ
jgi:hypothetical protein